MTGGKKRDAARTGGAYEWVWMWGSAGNCDEAIPHIRFPA